MEVLTAKFHSMNTDLHWFALFLHPLCRKLAICSVTHSQTLKNAIRIGFGIAKKWEWSEAMAQKLAQDLKDYYVGNDPFTGGRRDARDWWISLIAMATAHPLKAMAIQIFAIVPHSGDMEQYFLSLGLVQSWRQAQVTTKHMQSIGSLRHHYVYKIQKALLAQGKPIQRQHTHMHTSDEPGINLDCAKELTGDYTWVPIVDETEQKSEADGDAILVTEEDVEAKFVRLGEYTDATVDGDQLDKKILIENVYDISILDEIWKGKVTITVEEELILAKGEKGKP